ncbi:MAG TPA: hypothetical protein VHM70_03710 [Polyangiaceae bacterium]|jgi:hypothetical protein|nr:hypothetical protein [Polyangiaceae bacterium]
MDPAKPSSTIPTEFVPVSGGGETTSASSILVGAYLLLWIILMVFVAINWRRQRAIIARLDDVERSLDSR